MRISYTPPHVYPPSHHSLIISTVRLEVGVRVRIRARFEIGDRARSIPTLRPSPPIDNPKRALTTEDVGPMSLGVVLALLGLVMALLGLVVTLLGLVLGPMHLAIHGGGV